MTPEEYEHLVAGILRSEGWDAQPTPYMRDFGIDVVAERAGRRLGVQAKMYDGANRKVGVPAVMQTYGAAAYADCTESMIATDSTLTADATRVAHKLGVAVRIIAAAHVTDAVMPTRPQIANVTFGRVWAEHVMPLAKQTLVRDGGKANEILKVDAGGLTRRTSRGNTQRIDIEIFRWTVEKLLSGETVSRDAINAQYPGRASSGITLVLSAVPLFEAIKVGRGMALRMAPDPPVASSSVSMTDSGSDDPGGERDGTR